MTEETSKNKVARIENSLILNAQYHLSAKEQKIIVLLASQLTPKTGQKGFHKQLIPVKELEEYLKNDDKQWKSTYDRLDNFCNRLTDRKIRFPSDYEVDGKQLRGYLNWFQSVMPVKNEHGQLCIEFLFSEKLKPFLLKLSEYVRINGADIAPMTHSHAIRAYHIFKAGRDRRKKHQQRKTSMIFEIEEFKGLLGISGKYNVLKDFRRRVLEPIKQDINEHSKVIKVIYEYKKTKRKVTHIEWSIKDKTRQGTAATVSGKAEKYEDRTPTEKEIKLLSRAKLKAYNDLVAFGVKPGIVYSKILPNIKGSEFSGFEDYFVDQALAHFKKWSKHPDSAAVFVDWWHNKKIFDTSSEVWSKMAEKVIKAKKALEKQDPDAFANRLAARHMTNEEFEIWFKSNSATLDLKD